MKIPALTESQDKTTSLSLPARLAANGGLLLLWVWLFYPVYAYLGVIFSRQEFRTNQIVLVGVIALIVMQIRKGDLRVKFDVLPQLYPPALAMALLGSFLFLLAERFVDINTLSASLFGLATYGLLGLWMQPRRWRQGLPAALLLIGALPFGEHMDTFIGYPVRLVTARIVRDGLAALGAQSVSVDTILIFESGVSQVDLPCSGVKSLWTGGMFLLAITWIERRRVGLRWLLVAACFAILLLAANLARVALLVAVGQVLGWQLFAEMLHVPLGVIGFVAACAAAVGLLRWLPSDVISNPAGSEDTPSQADMETESQAPQPQPAHDPANSTPGSTMETDNPKHLGNPESSPSTERAPEPTGLPRPTWLPAVLAGLLVLMVLLYTPHAEPASARTPPVWNFDTRLNSQPWPFSPGEQEWLAQGEPLEAGRWRFQWGDFSGSVLVISSQTWRAHHRPERCFEVYGLSSNHSQTFLARQDFPLRQLVLGDGSQRDLYAAAYWFQSADQITDDYGTRMWADLAADKQPWTLVTVLFDQAYDPQDPQLVELYLSLRQSVQSGLEGGVQP